MSVEETFTVEIMDPCRTSIISFEPAIENMDFTIGQSNAKTQTIIALDSAHSTYGADINGNDLCGARKIEISPPDLAFLTFDDSNNMLTLFTTDENHITEVNAPVVVTVEAKLKEYPKIPAVTQSFNIQIFADCQNVSQMAIIAFQNPLPLR